MPTHMLYKAATGGTVKTGQERCCLCGHSCESGIGVDQVIRDTFTNHGLCRVPESSVACPACSHYFNHRWACGQKYESEYRKHSLFITESKVTLWQRTDMRRDLQNFLLFGCPRCVLVIGLSKKKHCLPLAKVNEPGKSFTVQLEEEQVNISADPWFRLLEAFDGLLSLDMLKGGIITGNYRHKELRGSVIGKVLALDRIIAPYRHGSLLSLVSYVTLVEDGDDSGETQD